MHKEKSISVASGWLLLPMLLLILGAMIWLFVSAIRTETVWTLVVSLVGLVLDIILMTGFFVVNPNEAAALLLFGDYKGTVKSNGFCWTNPFMTKLKISLRARNLNGEKIKVNDLSGNPIEIAAVAARQQIVEGAVGMVEMALDELSQKSIVDLDDERKAAMVSNLMVVLCSDHSAHPVINTGTL